jgi:hypothetical protein
MSGVVELGPIVKVLHVRRSARDAFRIFTEDMSAWWPLGKHSAAKFAEGEVSAGVTVEPRVGGRVYETLTSGEERDWGEVTAFEPGALFALRWRLGRMPPPGTDVSVRFEPLSDASCRVTLTHEHWERVGADGPALREGYNNGWVSVFERGFGDFAGRL